MFDESPALQLRHCPTQLFLRVHEDRAVRLLDRLSGHQEEPDPFRSGLDHQFVPRVEQ